MTIDLIIFIAFLSVNLILGLLAGSRVKTLREYAVGKKNFSTSTVTSTIVATWIGGGFMFYSLQNIYTTGLPFILVLLGGSVCLLLMGQVLSRRMGEFLNSLSIAEAMGKLYGKPAQVITALSGSIAAIGWIGMQFKVIGKMITLIFGFEGPWVTTIAACIVILYSSFGGIRSVTITDVFQFVTFSIFIPVLALIIWRNLKNPTQIAEIIHSNPLFGWKEVFAWNRQTLSMLGLMLYFTIPGMSPSIFQRIAMSKDLEQAKDSFTYAAGINALIMLSVAWVAILLLADPTVTDPSSLLNHIIDHYAYSGLKGLIAVGITAMAMSTADSDINATAVLITNDLLKPLLKEGKAIMLKVRMAAMILGVFALVLALYMQNLLDILLFSDSFYMPIVTAPFLLAIFGFRSQTRSMLIGVVAGFTTVILWSIFLDNADSIIPGLVANLVFFMGSHYLLKEQGGWIGIKDKTTLILAHQRRKETWRRLKHNLTIPQIYKSLQNALPAQDSVYPLFALYVIGATYVAFFTVPQDITKSYEGIYSSITISTLIATASFLTCPVWPIRFRPQWFMAFVWPIGISYLLFVVGGILVIMSGFNSIQVMIFMMNLIIAALLLPWQLVALLGAGSLMLVRVVLHTCGLVVALEGPVASLQFKIFYIILLFSGSLLAIIKVRQRTTRLQLSYTTLSTAYQETNKELVKALNAEERFLKALDVEGIQELEKTAEQEQQMATYLSHIHNRFLPDDFQHDLLKLKERLTATAQYLNIVAHRATTYLQLQVGATTPKELIDELMATLQLIGLPILPRVILEMKANLQSKQLEVDTSKLNQLFYHAIFYTQSKLIEPQQPILLGIGESMLGYVLNSVKGHVKRIPGIRITITTKQEVPVEEKLYYSNMEQSIVTGPIDQNSIHLLLSQRIVQAHYGFMAVEEANGNVTQVYVIPQDIRSVRPKEMDIPELDPEAKLQLSEETYPGAKEQEEDFLKSLQLEDQEQLTLVHKALRLIKKYHGPVKRKSGEPFYLHPVAVAKIVSTYTQDLDTILGALLHDVVEDTAVSLPQIELILIKTSKEL